MLLVFMFALLIQALFLKGVQSGPCDYFVTIGNECYRIERQPMTWFEAKDYCEMLGSNLLEIDNIIEQDRIHGLLLSEGLATAHFWVGGNDLHSEGVWEWALRSTEENVGWGYWYPGNPSDSNDGEDCMEILMYAKGLWNDKQCLAKQMFVCEKVLTGGPVG